VNTLTPSLSLWERARVRDGITSVDLSIGYGDTRLEILFSRMTLRGCMGWCKKIK
jgi:hypothetical protein